MIVKETPLKGLLIIEQAYLADERGLFCQQYRLDELNFKAVQSNISISHKNVLRGFHYQVGDYAQAKLISVLQGVAMQVALDLRKDSPTYMHHFKTMLNASEPKSVLLPRGFANAILSLGDDTIVHYLLDNSYSPNHEAGIVYNDVKLGVEWPKVDFIISPKDRTWPAL